QPPRRAEQPVPGVRARVRSELSHREPDPLGATPLRRPLPRVLAHRLDRVIPATPACPVPGSTDRRPIGTPLSFLGDCLRGTRRRVDPVDDPERLATTVQLPRPRLSG